jgi:hypothetical protein
MCVACAYLGGNWSAPAGLQRLQLLLHHLEQILHLFDFAAMTVLHGLNFGCAFTELLLGFL